MRAVATPTARPSRSGSSSRRCSRASRCRPWARSNPVNANRLRRWMQLHGHHGAAPNEGPWLLPVTVVAQQARIRSAVGTGSPTVQIESAGAHAGVDRGGPHRHEEGLRRPGCDRADHPGGQPVWRSRLCFAVRDRRGDIVKVLWFDGQGMVLLSKRQQRGRAGAAWRGPGARQVPVHGLEHRRAARGGDLQSGGDSQVQRARSTPRCTCARCWAASQTIPSTHGGHCDRRSGLRCHGLIPAVACSQCACSSRLAA